MKKSAGKDRLSNNAIESNPVDEHFEKKHTPATDTPEGPVSPPDGTMSDLGAEYIRLKQQTLSSEKDRVASFVVSNYVNDLDAVAIDAGSTMQQIVHHMMIDKKFLSILTNNMTAYRQNAREHVSDTANEFILTGGKYVALFDALLGNETLSSFEQFNPNIIMIGVSGFIPDQGFFCHGNDEKPVKELLFNKEASTIVIPVDYKKLGRSDSYLFGKTSLFKGRPKTRCLVVLMPPLPPTTMWRTSDQNKNLKRNQEYNKALEEYQDEKKRFNDLKKTVGVHKHDLEVVEVPVPNEG